VQVDDELALLSTRLSAPDAILEESTLDTDVRQFVAHGGEPATLIRLLSQSYRGHAQTCNLLGDWLDSANAMVSAGTAASEASVSTTTTTATTTATSSATATTVTSVLPSATQVAEELIKTLIAQKFDPKKADTIWGRKAAPEWLDYMISDPHWRALLYRLSADHKDCLLLNFAIQRISDAGHQSEIASLATASAYFSVFNRVLATSLIELGGMGDAQFAGAIEQLAAMTDRTQHTFAYSLAVLRRLAASPQVEVALAASRVAREIELRADQRAAATQLAMRLDGAAVHASVQDSITLMLSADATNPSDIIKLFNAYGGGGSSSSGPGGSGGGGGSGEPTAPVQLLHHARLIELLCNDLFNSAAARHLHAAHRHKYLHLLALATAGSATDVFTRTRAALDSVQRVSSGGPIVAKERREAHAILQSAIALPVGALSVLVWLKSVFGDREYFTVSYDVDLMTSHMQLLDEIAERHPLLCERVLAVFRLPIELGPGADLEALTSLEVKRRAIDSLSRIMLRGLFVMPVVKALREWQVSSTIDQSLIRRFIETTIAVAQPPFSEPFLQAFLELCSDERSLPSLRSSSTMAPLRQWLESCAANAQTPRSQLAALERLQSELGSVLKRKFGAPAATAAAATAVPAATPTPAPPEPVAKLPKIVIKRAATTNAATPKA
jgi:negative elongation factor C/D